MLRPEVLWWAIPIFCFVGGFYFWPQGKEARIAAVIVWLIGVILILGKPVF